MMIRKALLDDWAGVKELWGRLQAGRHAHRIPGSLEGIEKYFAASLTDARVAFPVLYVGDVLRGFAIMHDAVSMDLDESRNLAPNKVAFIRVVHLEQASPEYSRTFRDWINCWAKMRGAISIQGYCSLDFPLKAYARLHGVTPLWYLVGREVE